MKWFIAMFSAFILVGCGGAEFTGLGLEGTGSGGDQQGDAEAPAADADDSADARSTSTGGTNTTTDQDSAVGSGGARVGAGGASATGGVASSGGTSATDTGGTSSSGGATGCTLVTHNNGIGQTWQDCIPLGVYNKSQAIRACTASGAAQCFDYLGCGEPDDAVMGYDAAGVQILGIWGYGADVAGLVSPGETGKLCEATLSTTNKRWE